MPFTSLELPEKILTAVQSLGYKTPTPVQEQSLPALLKGQDLVAQAQTGTGKTAAFLIAACSHLLRPDRKKRQAPKGEREDGRKGGQKARAAAPSCLIIAPTRELAQQIYSDALAFTSTLDVAPGLCHGGTPTEPEAARLIAHNPDILAGTPGRLLDHLKRGRLDFAKVEILVIDEADRLLDMGFIPDVRRLVYRCPPKENRQTLFLSATITSSTKNLAQAFTKNPHQVQIDPKRPAAELVEQVIYIATKEQRAPIICNLLRSPSLQRALIFANRKDRVANLTARLRRQGIGAKMISGDVDQNRRTKTLAAFKSGKFPALVATDVAGRGIHIEGLSHVINFDLPEEPEDYVHRIGRTGRAGQKGVSVSFATEDDGFKVMDIQSAIGVELKCVYPPPELLQGAGGQKMGAAAERGRRFKNYGKKGAGGQKTGT